MNAPAAHHRPEPPAHPAGWLIIDKPIGISSNAVLARLKRQWGWKKLGFVGTLDPL
ncbi:MAG: tRNA pseudouridine(55) synthase TruB, partial [Alphaproteobacteria bacterium]|nr:tRNA pseudouridine(55) synthase TruB [Alphaproteobacteria bacterium]